MIQTLYQKHIKVRRRQQSRKEAFRLLRIIEKDRGVKIVNRCGKEKLQAYCSDHFGSGTHWPWLAVYTALRGEFVEGWMPSDYFFYQVLPRINPPELAKICLIKTMDYRIFGDLCVKPLISVVGDLVFNHDDEMMQETDAIQVLREFDRDVVVKYNGAWGGKKTFFMHASEVSLNDLKGMGQFVIQPFVPQHASTAAINHYSSNTLRVVTILEETGKVRVPVVIQKFGANGERVDNMSRGGRFVYIDKKGRAVSDAYVDRGLHIEERHPNTNKRYKDLVVPSIEKVHQLCISAHQRYPYVMMIGWDVIIDQLANPFIIEWNALYPAFWYHEAFVGPLFDMVAIKEMIE